MERDPALLEQGLFLKPVERWFHGEFERPTPAQQLAWPRIAAGESVLLIAPTGSGKTLAAFLACLDRLWRVPRQTPGVRLLYVTPLKALNHDVARNLERPLSGIMEACSDLGIDLPALSVGVRTGDSTPAERQRLVRKPPDILITTPESLHLMLTSRARTTLDRVSYVVVDEIHALAGVKRGVFLSLLLERLQALQQRQFQRIGLSATQRPLEEVARYLGGYRRDEDGRFVPRPVTIVDAGRRKDLDLEVSLPALEQVPGTAPVSVWPAIENRLEKLIAEHRSTIVFANNRRVAERLTARLNEVRDADETAGTDSVHSHHGSLSLERRRSTEDLLKSGDLKAVVATASLELGIDMGAVELVCQVESPGSISRGLQRVGRAGHLVGQTSKGRLIAKTPMDLLESAALAHAMLEDRIEALRVPINCLEVLAQQVVACVAAGSWQATELFDLARQAYPYRNLSAAAFESVLELISGRYELGSFRDLRPRVSWDRIHNRLDPLPGTAALAITGGGTIPDTGQFPVYLGDGGPRLGELDEEFVLERRVGESFVLGASTWSIDAIEPHRVLVSHAAGRTALLPFWRGESAHRTAELGAVIGSLCHQIGNRLEDPDLLGWLCREYALDAPSAQALVSLMARQYHHAGAAPDERTVLIETFRDPAGELGLAVLTTLGGKVHHALKLLLQASLRRRLGISVTALHGDDGVLIRLPGGDQPPRDLFGGLSSKEIDRVIREEVGESALFGLRFRQNAGRALLLPRPQPGRRTPLWLQRLRSKDLLQAVRQFPDFPIVVETYRECLDEDLDLPELRRLIERVESGDVRVVERWGEQPSPFTSGLVFEFSSRFLYEWDEPKQPLAGDRQNETSADLLESLLAGGIDGEAGLDERALGRLNDRLRYAGKPPRSAGEMFERLRALGDLSGDELSGPMPEFLNELASSGRAALVALAGDETRARWICAEELLLYQLAFPLKRDMEPDEQARRTIVSRYLRTHALVGRAELLQRYPVSGVEAEELLESWVAEGLAVRLEGTAFAAREGMWADPTNLADARRLTLAIRRKEAVAVAPEIYSWYLLRHHFLDPATQLDGAEAVTQVLERLEGFAGSPGVWELELLPRRVSGYQPAWLDSALGTGGWCWRACGEPSDMKVAIFRRDFAGTWPVQPETEESPESAATLAALRDRGACFSDELATQTGLDPSRVRLTLSGLMSRGLVTNDRFDPLRAQGSATQETLIRASSQAAGRRGRMRRRASLQPEGRWALQRVQTGQDPESSLLAWITTLLDRHGVLCRETAALDPWAPPWRELYLALDQAETRGEVRRGYFVEGLSGVQYAWSETAEELARLAAARATGKEGFVLISSLDPGNLYGVGAPFDVPLLEGGTATMSRVPSSYLVLRGGRPLLIIELYGKRLTGLASASQDEIRQSLGLLTSTCHSRRRILRVETYNQEPVLNSPAAAWLASHGFVRDPPGMVLYDTSHL